VSDEVKASIATQLATLVRTVDFPVAPFGFGSDIAGAADLDPNMRETNGLTTFALAEAIVRRLDCPRGALPDDKDYGIDLRSYVNRGVTAQDVRSLGGQIRSELSKDDRIDSTTVVLRPNSTGSILQIEIAVRPFDARLGGFNLTLSASSAAVLLEEIRSTK